MHWQLIMPHIAAAALHFLGTHIIPQCIICGWHDPQLYMLQYSNANVKLPALCSYVMIIG